MRQWGALGCVLIALCGLVPFASAQQPGAFQGHPLGGAAESGSAQGVRTYGYCRARAGAAFQNERHIDEDILATRGNDWQRAGTLHGERSDMFAEAVGRADAVLAGCLRAQGTGPG